MCRRSDGNMYSTKFGKLPIKWMAPESLKAGHFSHKSDTWSYGMLLYELFAGGQMPLSHVQPQEQLSVLEGGDRPLKPDNCPDEVYALMQRCWRMNPSQRPAIADLMKDLERIIDASAAEFGYLELCAGSDDIRPRSKRYAMYRRKPRITDDEAKEAVHL
ncbi:Tyrosine-protein kinase F09A5.2 in chromosome X [Aphelenchoides avenae]|nr:Tyrosine-protein kinase F09A5.2 in chromosome X [Aphelenchus avenae]